LQDRAHFVLRQHRAAERRAVRAGARRITQHIRRIHEHERVAARIVDVAVRADA
jgi:hypothetical protein